MSKIKSIIAGLSVVAGLGAAVLPMSAYAADTTGETKVTVTINAVISMSLESFYGGSTHGVLVCSSQASPECSGTEQEVRTTLYPNQADLTSMYTDIKVTTNSLAGYNLTMIDSDDDNSLSTTGGDTIAAINTTPVAGTAPGWAVSIDGGTTWQQVPAAHNAQSQPNTPITIKSPGTSSSVYTNDPSTVNYGVATSTSQAAGVYTDTVTFTATAK